MVKKGFRIATGLRARRCPALESKLDSHENIPGNNAPEVFVGVSMPPPFSPEALARGPAYFSSRWKNFTALPASIACFSCSGTPANCSSTSFRDSGQRVTM